MMIAAVAAIVDRAPLGALVKTRMISALPWLSRAVAEVSRDRGKLPQFLLAAANPAGAVVLGADVWPLLEDRPDTLDRGAAALCIDAAIADPKHADREAVFRGVAVVLEDHGVAALTRDYAAIAKAGRRPLVVVLTAQADGEVSVVVTVIEMPRPTFH
jgi:hypothetical protein